MPSLVGSEMCIRDRASVEALRTEAKSSGAPTPWRACRGAALREISLAADGRTATRRPCASIEYRCKTETWRPRGEQRRHRCENKRAECPSDERIESRGVETYLRRVHRGIPSPWKPVSTTILPGVALLRTTCEPGAKIWTGIDTHRGGSEVSPHLGSDEKFFVTGPVRTNPRTAKPSRGRSGTRSNPSPWSGRSCSQSPDRRHSDA